MSFDPVSMSPCSCRLVIFKSPYTLLIQKRYKHEVRRLTLATLNTVTTEVTQLAHAKECEHSAQRHNLKVMSSEAQTRTRRMYIANARELRNKAICNQHFGKSETSLFSVWDSSPKKKAYSRLSRSVPMVRLINTQVIRKQNKHMSMQACYVTLCKPQSELFQFTG